MPQPDRVSRAPGPVDLGGQPESVEELAGGGGERFDGFCAARPSGSMARRASPEAGIGTLITELRRSRARSRRVRGGARRSDLLAIPLARYQSIDRFEGLHASEVSVLSLIHI